MPDQELDLRFDLTGLDDPAATEVGVVLLGMAVPRLLAGLGLAALADDPGRVAVAVERLHHGLAPLDAAGLGGAGAAAWRAARPVLAAALPVPGPPAALRRTFDRVHAALDPASGRPAVLPGIGPASRVYLAVCWLRRAEVDPAAGVTGAD